MYRTYETIRVYIPIADEWFEPSESPKEDFPFPISKRQTRIPAKNNQFHLFSSLPTEIRIQVWEIAFREPRFLEIQFTAQNDRTALLSPVAGRRDLLTACRESRAIALKANYVCLYPKYRPWWGWNIDENSPWCTGTILFIPDIDTIFVRSLYAQAGLMSLSRNVKNANKIKHLALSIPEAGWSLHSSWMKSLASMANLRTLTLMVGGRENTWLGRQEIELRDVEEWFADGRTRTYKCDRWMMDIADVVRYLGGKVFEARLRGPAQAHKPDFQINVRAVAWKKDEEE